LVRVRWQKNVVESTEVGGALIRTYRTVFVRARVEDVPSCDLLSGRSARVCQEIMLSPQKIGTINASLT
jgi:hypothetical protein